MSDPIWLAEFRKYIGIAEIKGPGTHPEILRMIDLADGALDSKQLQGIRDDETPWCSSFKCGVYELAGIRSPRSAWARDWLEWGDPIPSPAYGATVVFARGKGGHTGDVVGRDQAGNLMVVGANQKDAVNIAPFGHDNVLGYRWPIGVHFPPVIGLPSLPLLDSDGRVLTQSEQG